MIVVRHRIKGTAGGKDGFAGRVRIGRLCSTLRFGGWIGQGKNDRPIIICGHSGQGLRRERVRLTRYADEGRWF